MKFGSILALVVALLALVHSNALATELTSGYYGEGYVIAQDGTMCYEPVPDDDPETLDFSLVDMTWLEYGMFVNIPAYQPEMYIGWLLVIIDGSSCLVAQGVVGTENPFGSSSDWAVENSSEATIPEESPSVGTVQEYSDTMPEAEIDQEKQTSSVEIPAQPVHQELASEPVVASTSQTVVVSSLPNTGAGEPKKMLKIGHSVAIFFGVMGASLAYATFKERREQVDALFDRVKEGSPRMRDTTVTLLLLLLSPAIVVGMATYAACKAMYTVAETLFLLAVYYWPERKQKSPQRERRATVLIR